MLGKQPERENKLVQDEEAYLWGTAGGSGPAAWKERETEIIMLAGNTPNILDILGVHSRGLKRYRLKTFSWMCPSTNGLEIIICAATCEALGSDERRGFLFKAPERIIIVQNQNRDVLGPCRWIVSVVMSSKDQHAWKRISTVANDIS